MTIFTMSAAVLFATASPAAAAGCARGSAAGFTIDVCISANGSQLRPDFYLVAKPANPPAGCRITSFLRGATNIQNAQYPCSTPLGRKGPWPRFVAIGPGLCYLHDVVLQPTNGSLFTFRSPPVCF